MESKALKENLAKEAEQLEVIALKERLAMSHEERIEAHENARNLFEDLKNAGEQARAKSQGAS